MVEDKISSLVLEKRVVMLFGEVNEALANDVIRKLWYLEWKDSKKEILLMINSPGGITDYGFAILDTIRLLKAKVTTLVVGLAASFGSVLSVASTSGKILATPNARIMIHQPLIGGMIRAVETDLNIHVKEIGKTREQIAEIYSSVTGRTVKEITELLLDRDTWMSPEEAKEFGLLTDIVESHSDLVGCVE